MTTIFVVSVQEYNCCSNCATVKACVEKAFVSKASAERDVKERKDKIVSRYGKNSDFDFEIKEVEVQ